MPENQETKYYFKVVQKKQPDGTVIDTNHGFDKERTVRYSKLKKLFDLIYNYSLNCKVPIQSIIFELRPDYLKSLVCDVDIVHWDYRILKGIKIEAIKSRFFWEKETKLFFNDYLIEKAQGDFYFLNTDLPDRSQSHFFFETKIDCVNYLSDINQQTPMQILIVEFVEVSILRKFDNRMINTFEKSQTSLDLLNNVMRYLRGELTNNPLIEVVFQGKYKIITTI